MIDLPTTEGGWAMVLADPPWDHKMRSPKGVTSRHASTHYPVMALADIKALPVKAVVARDCHLFLWSTWPHLEQALEVMRAWGFRYSSNFLTWVKLNPTKSDLMFMSDGDFHMGMGYTSRKNCEICLIGRRGSPKRLSRDVRELLIAPRAQHSRKPAEAYRRIEAYCPGPRLELFSRETREGWTAWGLETGKFDEGGAGAVSHDNAPARPARGETSSSQRRSRIITAQPKHQAVSLSLGLDEQAVREDE